MQISSIFLLCYSAINVRNDQFIIVSPQVNVTRAPARALEFRRQRKFGFIHTRLQIQLFLKEILLKKSTKINQSLKKNKKIKRTSCSEVKRKVFRYRDKTSVSPSESLDIATARFAS